MVTYLHLKQFQRAPSFSFIDTILLINGSELNGKCILTTSLHAVYMMLWIILVPQRTCQCRVKRTFLFCIKHLNEKLSWIIKVLLLQVLSIQCVRHVFPNFSGFLFLWNTKKNGDVVICCAIYSCYIEKSSLNILPDISFCALGLSVMVWNDMQD